MNHQSAADELPPHVLIFPLPIQGHVNSMLNLAELLCLSSLHVTVLLSDFAHNRLLRHANLKSRFSAYPSFRITTISDGLPADHPRVGEGIIDIAHSLKRIGGPQFRHMMESSDALSEGETRRRVSCLIMDGIYSFAIPVMEEMGIPYLYFRTASACSFWPYFCFQKIIDAGELPLKGKDEDRLTYLNKKEMDLMVTSLPGVEGILRRRDLPSFGRVHDSNDPALQMLKSETELTAKGQGLIFNSFEDLEGPVLDQIRKHIPNLYSVGPLHAHLKARLEQKGLDSSNRSTSLWDEDRSCMTWLDSQPANSVIYVNFGSVAILTREELIEFWHGLVNSGHRFLWVIRPDSVAGGNNKNIYDVPAELAEGTSTRGYMTAWVPQQEVLAHGAVGAFLTHSGWNSILESIPIGIPLLCWAYFADQTTNSRYVSEVWKLGLDIKDTCDRMIIQEAVKDIMEVRREEFSKNAKHMANLAKKAISEGGSSYENLDRLVEFLKSTAK